MTPSLRPNNIGCFRRIRHQPLTTRQFGRLFKPAAKAAGLRKTLTLHAFRHAMALLALQLPGACR
jgi:site-specific recombinase XerD